MNSDSELNYLYLTPSLEAVVCDPKVTRPLSIRKAFEAADEALRIRDSRIRALEELVNAVDDNGNIVGYEWFKIRDSLFKL